MNTYDYAIKLLSARDYTVSQLCRKLEAKYGPVPQDVLDLLLQKNFLNDQRFAENYVSKRKSRGPARLREELISRGIELSLADKVLAEIAWPSLKQSLKAKMDDWNLRAPLQSRDAARLFRALVRLGYDEDAIREEIDQFHDQ